MSDLVILDTKTWDKVGMVKLPLRVRPGLHGNFVPRDSMLRPDEPLVDFEWVPAKVSVPCIEFRAYGTRLSPYMSRIA